MRALLISSVLVLAACGGGGGGDDTTPPDADTSLPACTGVVFDGCTDVTSSSDCMAGLECHYFMMDNITACVPTCDATHPCPADVTGVAAECNNRGICKPHDENACTP